MTPSWKEIATAMEEAIAQDSSLRQRFNASVVFEVPEGPSQMLDVRKDSSSPQKKPDLVVQTTEQVLQDLLAKKLTPQQAFMKGKLKIKGKMGLAMKLTTVLNATRKRLGKQVARL